MYDKSVIYQEDITITHIYTSNNTAPPPRQVYNTNYDRTEGRNREYYTNSWRLHYHF